MAYVGQDAGLLECRLRMHEVGIGRYTCASRLLVITRGSVTAEFCSTCPVRDKLTSEADDSKSMSSSGPQRNPPKCMFFGEPWRTDDGRALERECKGCGGKLTRQIVYHCSHPAHVNGTIYKECYACSDYKEKET